MLTIMKKELHFLILFSIVGFISIACDVQSGIARKSVEPQLATPTPERSPIPTPTPIDPSDAVNVDTTEDGPTLSVNEDGEKKSLNCNKFNKVMVNGDKNTLTINGVCASVMFNGNGNNADINASAQFVFNGDNNIVTYSKYVNGKQFILTDNKKTNSVDKKQAGAKPTL